MRTRFVRGGGITVGGLFTAVVFASGCGPDRPAGSGDLGAAPSFVSAGDTTIVTNPAEVVVPVDTIDAVDVVWQDPALENPTVLVRAGRRLVVGDQTRLHLIDPDGQVRTVGRRGEGPGEFGWIAALVARSDTIFVLDGRLLRHSLFHVDGSYLDSHPVSWPAPWVNPPRDGAAIALRGDSLVRVATENVSTTRAQREALLVQPLEGDSARLVRSWDDARWVWVSESGRVLGNPVLFDAQGLVAVAADGRWALSDGLEYCIDVSGPEEGPVLRVCRAWERMEVGPGVRGASPSDVPADEDPARRDMLAAQFEMEEVPELRPSIDDLVFGEDGSLWVRTIGPETPDVHPYLLRYRPELMPTHRAWDRFDAEGVLTRTAWLPASFDPRIFVGDTIWGISTLETGEKVVARIDLPTR